MFQQCKEYLLVKLKEAGLKTQPYTSLKKLRASQESHIGAVLFDEESFTRNGSKTIYKDERGDRKKRRKVFDRNLTFDIIIGEYTQDKAEELFESFLLCLDKGMMVNGNYVPIEPETAEWVDEDDSILKAKIAVQLKVRFEGGIYKDTGFANVKDVAVDSVEIDRKENKDGK